MSDYSESITRLSRDLAAAAKTMTVEEARYLVDAYYMIQENRKASGNQVRALGESEEPHSVIAWLHDNQGTLEAQIRRALDRYTDAHELSQWAKSIVGIGPVIAAGLLAHVDMRKATYAGNIWSFAGLNPSVEWKKGEKRPYNMGLKVLCWKIGQSFMKTQNHKDDFYGKLYARYKETLAHNNKQGRFKDAARDKLERFNIGKTTEAYKSYSSGELPPAHIDARARRWVVKLFLSHYYEVGRSFMGLPYVRPYAFSVLHHEEGSYIAPPNFTPVPELERMDKEIRDGID